MAYTTKETSAAQEQCTVKGLHWIKNMVKTWLHYAFWAKDGVEEQEITDTSETQVISMGGVATLNNVASLTCTLADPEAVGALMVISQIDAGTAGHTVTCETANALDGTHDVATFTSQYDTLVLLSVATDRWIIVENIGDVGLTTA